MKMAWEWALASGETVRAEVDTDTMTESVWSGARLLGRSPVDAKPDGHDVPLANGLARLKIKARGTRCTLVVDGHAIDPTMRPFDDGPPQRMPDEAKVYERGESSYGRKFLVAGPAWIVVAPAFIFENQGFACVLFFFGLVMVGAGIEMANTEEARVSFMERFRVERRSMLIGVGIGVVIQIVLAFKSARTPDAPEAIDPPASSASADPNERRGTL